MDASRFDILARRVGRPTSRRTAMGAALAGGVLGALRVNRGQQDVLAVQGQKCVLDFTANVRTGPDAQQALLPGAQPGQLQGQLSFLLSPSGNLENGELLLPNGVSSPVVGQATGHSLQMRMAIGDNVTLVAIGVGEYDVTACQGIFDGLVTGPQAGDMGDWRAVVTQTSGGLQQQQAPAPAAPAAAAAAVTDTAQCVPGATFCDIDGGYCTNMQIDPGNCGACGNQCPDGICTAGACGTGRPGECPSPPVLCNGVCVDLALDPNNCGYCGNVCEFGCTGGGICATGAPHNCGAPFGVCAGNCVDLSKDTFNCGACGVVCEGDALCFNGMCNPDWCEGFDICDGLCTVTATDPDNCGACGIVCLPGETCVDGFCILM